MLADSILARSAALHPESVGLVCEGRRLTYGELDSLANALAVGLHDLGVARGDRVVMHLENSISAVVSIFGILRAGAVFVPVGPSVKADKLAYILNDSQAVAVIADARMQQSVADAVSRAPGVRATIIVSGDDAALPTQFRSQIVSFESLVDGNSERARPVTRVIDIDLAALVYTSGSTGQPKGVMLTHLNMVAAATSIDGYLQNTERDVILNVLPLSFDYGLYQVFLGFKAGARLVLERSCAYPAVLLDVLERERVTGLPVVPMLAMLLLKHEPGSHALSLRYVTNTGAALPPAHISELRRKFPDVRLFSMYGLTECKRVSFLSPDEIDARPKSVGKPMDNVEVFVADAQGELHETGTGELVVRGSNVMQGYWRAPEETARVLRPGRYPGEYLLYTGDLFSIDADGYMYFQSRLDDLIKSRGQRVSPKEIEQVIYELREVDGVVVVGVPDPVQGTALKACIVLGEGAVLSEQDVLRHCADRLEDFMIPRLVEFVATLPRTESGKLRRRSLLDDMKTQVGTPA